MSPSTPPTDIWDVLVTGTLTLVVLCLLVVGVASLCLNLADYFRGRK